MTLPSIYQIIEFLHHTGTLLRHNFPKKSNAELNFLLKILDRKEIENFLKRDVFTLNALDYQCYFFDKNEYMKFEPVGHIQFNINESNFTFSVTNFILSILYKNTVSLKFDSSSYMNHLIQTMNKTDEKLTKLLIKVDVKAKNDIELLKNCFLIEEEVLTKEDKEAINTYLALDETIHIIQIGKKNIFKHKNLVKIKNIDEVNKHITSSNEIRIGFILSPQNYFWIRKNLQNPIANIRDASIYHLYSCELERLRKPKSIVSADKLDDEFEYLDETERESIIYSKLNRIINIAKQHSKFYHTHLHKTCQLARLNDITEYPFLLPEHLRKDGYPISTNLLTKPLSNCYFFSTGGSTGAPKTSIRAVKDQYAVGKSHGKGMQLTNFNSNDIVANLFSAGSMWAGFQTMNIALERAGCAILPLANVLKPEELASVLITYKANAIMGMPSLVLSLAKYVEHHKVKGLKINKILVGGELVSDKMKEYLMSIFKLDVFSTACYSALDIGAIGYQCNHCQMDTYHINEDQVFLEVIDPDSLAPLNQGEKGELVATHIERELMPIIRYRFGDQGKILKEPCPCGRKARLLQLFGRADDTLIIGGHKVQPFNVESAIGSIDELSLNFQMIADEVDALDQFKLVVEANSEKIDKKTKARLEKELKKQTFKYIKLLDTASKIKGIKMPDFEVVPLNSLKRNTRTGKLKRVIDLRNH